MRILSALLIISIAFPAHHVYALRSTGLEESSNATKADLVQKLRSKPEMIGSGLEEQSFAVIERRLQVLVSIASALRAAWFGDQAASSMARLQMVYEKHSDRLKLAEAGLTLDGLRDLYEIQQDANLPTDEQEFFVRIAPTVLSELLILHYTDEGLSKNSVDILRKPSLVSEMEEAHRQMGDRFKHSTFLTAWAFVQSVKPLVGAKQSGLEELVVPEIVDGTAIQRTIRLLRESPNYHHPEFETGILQRYLEMPADTIAQLVNDLLRWASWDKRFTAAEAFFAAGRVTAEFGLSYKAMALLRGQLENPAPHQRDAVIEEIISEGAQSPVLADQIVTRAEKLASFAKERRTLTVPANPVTAKTDERTVVEQAIAVDQLGEFVPQVDGTSVAVVEVNLKSELPTTYFQVGILPPENQPPDTRFDILSDNLEAVSTYWSEQGPKHPEKVLVVLNNEVSGIIESPGLWLPQVSPRAAVRISPEKAKQLFSGDAARVAQNLRAMAELSLANRNVPDMDINSITFVQLNDKLYAVITSA